MRRNSQTHWLGRRFQAGDAGRRRHRTGRIGTASVLAATLITGLSAAVPASAAVHPNAIFAFKGFESVFVDDTGHLRSINPNGSIEEHGPALALGGSFSSVTAAGLPNGTFAEVFAQGDGNILDVGRNNENFGLFETFENTVNVVDPNSTPVAAVDRTGRQNVEFAQKGKVISVSNFGQNAGHAITLGSIGANTSPVTTPNPGFGQQFLSAWVDPNGHLNWTFGIGEPVNVVPNITVHSFSSPSIYVSNNRFKIDVRDAQNHLWEIGTAINPVETAFSISGSPSQATLSNGAEAIAFVNNATGELWVQDRPTGHFVELGNNPAIAADGSGGWKVIFMGLNLHAQTLDSAGHFTDIPIPMNGDTSPTITQLFTD